MKIHTLLFSMCLSFVPTLVFGACSVANLTRCLDSVCAINIGANPAARCQYCGTNDAGDPVKSGAMKNISTGTSAKYVVSDKELKSAPKDAGERYIWGTKLCLERVTGCTPDDVTDNYDKLIEQSCRAAGISSEMASLARKANVAKTQSACLSEIETCIEDSKRCGTDYRNCESDENFDKQFSDCSVLSTGCESFLSDIRTSVDSGRKTAIANADKILQNIINATKTAREQKLANAQADCKDNKAKNDCISRVCQNNMKHQCEIGYEYEKSLAGTLCEFYDVACGRLK